MKLNRLFLFVVFSLILYSCTHSSKTISFASFNIQPNAKEDASTAAKLLVERLQSRKDTTCITVIFPKGRYDFYPDSAFMKEYYISNHDQDNPKAVAFAFENLKNVIIDGQGSEFVFHGRMIPFSILNSHNITLKNLTIDFEIPALRQLEVLEVDRTNNSLIAKVYPESCHRVEGNSLIAVGEGYENPLLTGMPFRKDHRLAYNRQDVAFNPETIEEPTPNTLILKNWHQIPLTQVGERFALRSWHRPTPGIFMSECRDMLFENVKVHYAEGMGLLAQMSENITLDGFSVCLKDENDPRYFTTQADATHFSACKGIIISKNGLYEGMADDAINVHGTYLRITKRVNDKTLHARYMHPQAWGFKWGEKGDSVQFVESEKMEIVENHINTVASIKALDKPSEFGAKEFEITFTKPLPLAISEAGKYGIENLTWTPEVIFTDNTIRNNRARGALFSTPKRVVCENNTFDHTHGTAILLCGDCNGWFETGACRNVVIRNNTFINALTANYQFTNAIISIYPEIPSLEKQEKYFHSGIVIEENTFETFDQPILYAKSTDGLIFRKNTIKHNTEFEPFHWNKYPFFFEKVDNIIIENNTFEASFNFYADKDVRKDLSAENAVTINQ